MTVRVLFLGPAQRLAQCREATVTVDAECSLQTLVSRLEQQYPSLAGLGPSVRYAVNETFANPDQMIREGDVVAVIPPVSGGSGPHVHVDLLASQVDVAALHEGVRGDGRWGGVVTFEGITREDRHAEHGELIRLHYEAYETMALKQMRQLAETVVKEQGAGAVMLVHRLGDVELGESSIYIGVACPHRAAAFDGCRWLIDRVKQEVPIWKQELWQDGQTTWVDPTTGQIHGQGAQAHNG